MSTRSDLPLRGVDAWLALEPYELEYHLEQFDHPMRYTVALIDFLERHTALGAGASWRVLDDGTGAGGALKWLAEAFPGCEFVGVDVNPELIRLGAERLEPGAQVSLQVRDSLAGADMGLFDLCVSQQVVSWLSLEQSRGLIHAQMHAASRAVAAVGLFTERSADYSIEVHDHDASKQKPITILSARTLQRWADEAGWHLTATEPFDMDFPLDDNGRARDIWTLDSADGRRLAFAGEIYMPWGIALFEKG